MEPVPRVNSCDVDTSNKHYNIINRQRPSNKNNKNESRLSHSPVPGAHYFSASLSVEAALALPLFLLVLSLFFTFFSGQLWQLRLQKAIDEICEDVAVWSYILDFADDYTGSDLLALAEGGRLSGVLKGNPSDLADLLQKGEWREEIKLFALEKGSALIWQRLIKEWLIRKLGREALTASLISGGPEGLSLSGSTLRNRNLDLVLAYRIHSPFSLPFRLEYPIVQRSCRRLWIGTRVNKTPNEEEETEEETVYVTGSGQVYHISRQCRVLAITPTQTDESGVVAARNLSGAKYKACQRCTRGRPVKQAAWVTPYGTRYHLKEDCSSLIRNIGEIAISEAEEKYRPCHYCTGGS